MENLEVQKKKPKKIEVQCLLHTQCNLRCKFCFETKEKGIRENNCINLDYIKQLPDQVTALLLDKTRTANIDMIEISMMGGEIFSDNLPDSMFDVYREFANSIRNKLRAEIPNIECKFKCLSNGVYKNHKRVEAFLREFNARLILSYDPVDRFTSDKQKEIWLNTFNYFNNKKEFALTISAVLTKRSIAAYIDVDDIFEKIGNVIFIDGNIYVPRLDYEEYLPNDDDIFNFYKWALDNGKFNISLVNNILLSHAHGVILPSCGSSRSDFIFGEDFEDKYGWRYINKCTEESPICKDKYYGSNASLIPDATNCSKYKQPLGMQKRGCLMCEYFSKCPKVCWTQTLFDQYKVTVCPVQRVYKYLESNPQIVDAFEKWRESK